MEGEPAVHLYLMILAPIANQHQHMNLLDTRLTRGRNAIVVLKPSPLTRNNMVSVRCNRIATLAKGIFTG